MVLIFLPLKSNKKSTTIGMRNSIFCWDRNEIDDVGILFFCIMHDEEEIEVWGCYIGIYVCPLSQIT